jgi:ligand-binding sensor domain-containing protein/signal transduction histidine kinase
MVRRHIFILLLLTSVAQAEKLPLQVYTPANGLSGYVVEQIVQDALGFLWLATPEGLSRFDGYVFKNYGIAEGLPDEEVLDLLLTRDGQLWIGTANGVARFRPERARRGEPRFSVYQPAKRAGAHRVTSLAEDARGQLWCGTFDGVYRMTPTVDGQVRFEPVEIGLPSAENDRTVNALMADSNGSLWVGTWNGLFRLQPDGSVTHYTLRDGLPHMRVDAVLEDHSGRIWVGTFAGLWTLDPTPKGNLVPGRTYKVRDGLVDDRVQVLLEDGSDIWVGTFGGLSRIVKEPSGQLRFNRYKQAHGLPYPEISALAKDREGNLWIGALSGGLVKFATSGFVTYSEADGLDSSRIAAIFETRTGELSVVTGPDGGWKIHRFDGTKFTAITPNYPSSVKLFGWGWNQHVLEDHLGDWWLPSGSGLWRFPSVTRLDDLASTAPSAVYTTQEGLPGDEVFRVYEDRRGDIWVANVGPYKTFLARWDRATGRFVEYKEADGAATAFQEDALGRLWIGFFHGGLARYSDGRMEFFDSEDGIPAGTISDLYLDHTGRLWISSFQAGLAYTDSPGDERPQFKPLTVREGLSSNVARCLTEDEWGRIYIGTGEGVDRLDPQTGRIRHYSESDGLPHADPTVAFRDKNGVIWFGTLNGLTRLIPEPSSGPGNPRVYVTRVEAGESNIPVSELGETAVTIPTLDPDQNRVQISFVGLGFTDGDNLRYQYILDGADHDWSALQSERIVRYANLAPGTYRFQVRALNSEGQTSSNPASVAFRIASPFWQRWWFQGSLLLIISAVAYGLHRLRLSKLIAVERVRTRIASDLHDDIGAGLTRVGILSELVLRSPDGASVTSPVARIAALSRELGASMNDIVWSAHPGKDRVRDLTQRMRRQAAELFTACDIDFRFQSPEYDSDRLLNPEIRREVFLIFKEAVNNIVRHAQCTTALIDISIDDHLLVLVVSDDGRGFRTESVQDGNGLESMRRRARHLGADLAIRSGEGSGSTVVLRVPVSGRAGFAGRTLRRLAGVIFRLMD